jgi:mycothiol S-conjugate amidase
VVTYPPNQKGYPHPDHLRVNEISEVAFDAAGDPDQYPEAGPAWQPLRLFYVRWSLERVKAMHEKYLELGLESPFTDRIGRMLDAEAEADINADNSGATHVLIDIRGHGAVMRDSLLAHETQVDPTSPHWFGLPRETSDELYPYDEYDVGRDLTGYEVISDDLFVGLEAVPVV